MTHSVCLILAVAPWVACGAAMRCVFGCRPHFEDGWTFSTTYKEGGAQRESYTILYDSSFAKSGRFQHNRSQCKTCRILFRLLGRSMPLTAQDFHDTGYCKPRERPGSAPLSRHGEKGKVVTVLRILGHFPWTLPLIMLRC